MDLLIIGTIWLLNVVISTINSFSVGFMFRRKNATAWEKLMAWCGYIMAGSGYSWCILIVLALVALATGHLDEEYTAALLNLGYIVIVPCVLFTGYIITIDSIIGAVRKRSLARGGLAAYNTFASAHNTFNAFRYLPQAFGSVVKTLSKAGSGKSKMGALVLLLCFIALVSGFLISGLIVWKVAQGEETLA